MGVAMVTDKVIASFPAWTPGFITLLVLRRTAKFDFHPCCCRNIRSTCPLFLIFLGCQNWSSTCSSAFQWLYNAAFIREEHYLPLLNSIVFKIFKIVVTKYTKDTLHKLHTLVVPNTEAALLCWSAMDTLWRRNEKEWWSCVNSLLTPATRGLNSNWYKMVLPGQQSGDFSLFLSSAALATALASLLHQMCVKLRRCQHK